METHQKIKFAATENSLFFPTLKKRVDQYFTQHNKSRYANRKMVIKTVVLLAVYLVPFIALLVFQPSFPVSMLLWIVMGVGIAGIGMSIMHDANHGAYSASSSLNKWLGRTLHLAGAGVTNWKLQHNLLHHTFTNVVPLDEDIRDRGVIKLSPHSKAAAIHKFQWLYAFFFYGLLTLYWVLVKDFIQYYGFIKSGVNRQSNRKNAEMFTTLVVLKTVYLICLLLVPAVVFHIPFGQVLAGFLIMHFTSGLLLTVIFQLAHTVEGTDHPLADEKGIIRKNWAVHQLETTVNFSPRNKWLSWYIGGLNFQIEHHLFPKICHVHYPDIAPIVRQTAREFGIAYLENPTFVCALKSHLRALRRFGKLPALNEAIG